MKKTFTTEQEIIKSLEHGGNFRISSETRSRMKAELSAYADMHSVPTPIATPYTFSFTFLALSRRSVYAFAMLLLLIGTSAGTSFASEKTLPGDLLYSVKLRITEPVRTALISSVKAKASWEAELAARRLQEATELAATNRLNTQTGIFLTEEFSAHVASSLAGAQTLSESGDPEGSADVRSELEARVTAHAAILALVSNHSDDNSESKTESSASIAIRNISNEVRVKQAEITSDRITLETPPVSEPATMPIKQVPAVSVTITEAEPVLLKVASTTDTQEQTLEKAVPAPAIIPVENKVDATVSLSVEKRETARAAEIADIFQKNKALISALGTSAPATTTIKMTAPTTIIKTQVTPEKSGVKMLGK